MKKKVYLKHVMALFLLITMLISCTSMTKKPGPCDEKVSRRVAMAEDDPDETYQAEEMVGILECYLENGIRDEYTGRLIELFILSANHFTMDYEDGKHWYLLGELLKDREDAEILFERLLAGIGTPFKSRFYEIENMVTPLVKAVKETHEGFLLSYADRAVTEAESSAQLGVALFIYQEISPGKVEATYPAVFEKAFLDEKDYTMAGRIGESAQDRGFSDMAVSFFHRLGEACERDGDLGNAAMYYKKAGNDEKYIANQIAYIESNRESLKTDLEDLRNTMDSPFHVRASDYAYGRIFCYFEEYDEALSHYALVPKEKRDDGYYYAVADCYLARKDLAKAEDVLAGLPEEKGYTYIAEACFAGEDYLGGVRYLEDHGLAGAISPENYEKAADTLLMGGLYARLADTDTQDSFWDTEGGGYYEKIGLSLEQIKAKVYSAFRSQLVNGGIKNFLLMVKYLGEDPSAFQDEYVNLLQYAFYYEADHYSEALLEDQIKRITELRSTFDHLSFASDEDARHFYTLLPPSIKTYLLSKGFPSKTLDELMRPLELICEMEKQKP